MTGLVNADWRNAVAFTDFICKTWSYFLINRIMTHHTFYLLIGWFNIRGCPWNKFVHLFVHLFDYSFILLWLILVGVTGGKGLGLINTCVIGDKHLLPHPGLVFSSQHKTVQSSQFWWKKMYKVQSADTWGSFC